MNNTSGLGFDDESPSSLTSCDGQHKHKKKTFSGGSNSDAHYSILRILQKAAWSCPLLQIPRALKRETSLFSRPALAALFFGIGDLGYQLPWVISIGRRISSVANNRMKCHFIVQWCSFLQFCSRPWFRRRKAFFSRHTFALKYICCGSLWLVLVHHSNSDFLIVNL